MKMETEAQEDAWRKEQIVPFSSVATSASVELMSQTSKCEPVLTEVEMEGWTVSVSASVAGVYQALDRYM